VRVDWTMANELTLVGINDMYTKIGRPGVANKERVVRPPPRCGWAGLFLFVAAPETFIPLHSPARPPPPPFPARSGWPWTTPWTPATTTSPSPPR
jgi:hypothetical protein